MERIMVDTSAIYALLDSSDNFHKQAVSFLKALSLSQNLVLVTNFIVAESHALLANRPGPEIAGQWLKGLCWPIERVTIEDENRAREIIYSHTGKSFSFTDATTFAVMERLGIKNAPAFDQHFTQYGLNLYNL
ncbi:MAG: type II toxin-antitoxin system VapC family toxin [Bacillota bacterium]